MNGKFLITIVKLMSTVDDKRKTAIFSTKKLAVAFLFVVSVAGANSQTNNEHSLRPSDGYAYSDGWLYSCENDNNHYSFYRVRLSDLKKEIIARNVPYTEHFVVDINRLFFSDEGLYRRRFDNNNNIPLKRVVTNVGNIIDNVILFNNRLYYTQPIDNTDSRKAVYNICSINTDGTGDKKLTGRYYESFCIYKGMIFARNGNTTEIDKLNNNGSLIDNYGEIGRGYFDVYNDCIYYLEIDYNKEISLLYKIDINTKNKQLIKGYPFTILNPIISNNHLVFNTKKQQVMNQNTNASIGFFGDICSINLESGELKRIYTEQLCSLFYVYNDIVYCTEFVERESDILEFQINIDGTDKKRVELFR